MKGIQLGGHAQSVVAQNEYLSCVAFGLQCVESIGGEFELSGDLKKDLTVLRFPDQNQQDALVEFEVQP
ncbi:hypothetical protein, partial [Klebsiella pneumoniae]|uniref:hypothetical protein n=1 Tax=Klebsiella pneumoniae TaxID=573 RepID=UPI0039C3AFA1